MSDTSDTQRPRRFAPVRAERLEVRALPGVMVRAFARFREQGMTDWAATLAYNTIMAIVPVLLVAASVLTLVGSSSLPQTIADHFLSLIEDRTSGTTAGDSAAAVKGLIQTALDNARTGAGIALVLSVLLAVNGASGTFAAAGRALNAVNHSQESRGFVRSKLVNMATALLVILLLAAASVLFVLGGGIADSVFSWLGLDDVPAVWSILRIPLGLGALLLAIDIVFARAPNLPDRPFRLATTGALTALVAWLLATLVFMLYVQIAGFGSAYGALGGAIVLLFWLYLSSAAFLFGAEVDAEVEQTLLMRGDGPPAISGENDPLRD